MKSLPHCFNIQVYLIAAKAPMDGHDEEEEDEFEEDDELEEETLTTDGAEKPELIMDPGQKALNDLLAGGARFLMGLSQALAPQKLVHLADSEAKTEHPLESIVQKFIERTSQAASHA